MPVRRLSDAALVAVLAVVALVITAIGGIVAPAASDVDTGTSSFSAGPLGTKAAYLTLRELGYTVERSHEALAGLHLDAANTVIVLSGAVPPSAGDMRMVQRFLEEGGTVMAMGPTGARVLGVPAREAIDMAMPFGDVKTYARLGVSPVSAGADSVTMPEDLTGVQPPAAGQPIYGETDRPVITVSPVGKGLAIWMAAATPLTNAHVADAGNLQFLLNVVGGPGRKRVLFDEHYQGFTRSLWSYAAGTPLPWITLQLGLVAMAAFLTFSRRFGPVRVPATDPRTSPMEFVDMLGSLYQRAGAPASAVAAARTRLRRTLASACGVPATSEDAALARTAAARLGRQAEAIADLLAETERASADPDLDPKRALALTRSLQAWSARLQAARGTGELSGGVI